MTFSSYDSVQKPKKKKERKELLNNYMERFDTNRGSNI